MVISVGFSVNSFVLILWVCERFFVWVSVGSGGLLFLLFFFRRVGSLRLILIWFCGLWGVGGSWGLRLVLWEVMLEFYRGVIFGWF